MEKQSRKSPVSTLKASTREVLGEKRQAPTVPSKWRPYYEQLLKVRSEVLQQQAGLVKDATDEKPTFSTHMADAGTGMYDRDLALGVLSNEQDELYQIEQALDRIRNKTYGICELTGKPIEPARLQAVPWTRFCAAAGKRMEQQNGVRSAHLGRRNTVVNPEAPESTNAKQEKTD